MGEKRLNREEGAGHKRRAMKRRRYSTGSDTKKGIREAEEGDDLVGHILGTSLTDLPSHITTDILLRLPIKSILICKCVCKSWHTIISDPRFAQLHFECAPANVLVRTSDPKRVSRTLHLLEFDSIETQNLAHDNDCDHLCSCEAFLGPGCNNHMKLEGKFKLPLRDANMVLDKMLEAKSGRRKRTCIACKPRDDKFDVVNSCNGLLCLCNPCDGNPLVVCNPITGEFTRLPEASKVSVREPFHCGFGFLKKTNEYKVIRIYNRFIRRRRYPRWSYDYTVVEIHTMGTGLWRSIEYHTHWSGLKFPTCLNGSLHWFVYNHTGASILCFDLENETFSLLPCPSSLFVINETNVRHIHFGEFMGFLFVCYLSTSGVNFWTMKAYGDGQSWSKVLSIDSNNCKYWRFLDPYIWACHRFNCYIYYEHEKDVFRQFKVCGSSFMLEPISHIPSLVKLKDAVKGGNIEVLNVHSRCATFKLREEKDDLYLVKLQI